MYALDYANSALFDHTLTTRMEAVAQNDPNGVDDAHAGLTELESRICDGLRAGEFHVVFRGAYRGASGELTRVEAQVRWTHPDYGLLLPGIFMMSLEHQHVVQEMASFVVDSVCREIRGCLDAQLPLRKVAIAVPVQIALLDSFADDLARAARSYRIPLDLFEIEVSDSAEAAKLLSLCTMTGGLRELGVGIALGKWGSDTSSLALLGTLDVDTITVAQELMGAVPRDKRACIVTSALLDLLFALGIRVVVSGVETEQQLRWLSQWPEVLVQGTFLSRPQQELADLLA